MEWTSTKRFIDESCGNESEGRENNAGTSYHVQDDDRGTKDDEKYTDGEDASASDTWHDNPETGNGGSVDSNPAAKNEMQQSSANSDLSG